MTLKKQGKDVCKPKRRSIFSLDLPTSFWKLSTRLPVLASVQRRMAMQQCSARKSICFMESKLIGVRNQQSQTMMTSGAITGKGPSGRNNMELPSYDYALLPYRICWLGEISDVDRHRISTHRAWYFHRSICCSGALL